MMGMTFLDDDDGSEGDDLRLAGAIENVYSERDPQAQPESQLNEELNDDDLDPLSLPTTIRDSQRFRSDDSYISDDHSLKRQDSATSATSPDLAPSSHTSIESGDTAQDVKESPRKPLRALPRENRGGQKLRWSLPSRALEDGRAEESIHTGRLEGESKSARRRRVRREKKLVQSLFAVSADDDR